MLFASAASINVATVTIWLSKNLSKKIIYNNKIKKTVTIFIVTHKKL